MGRKLNKWCKNIMLICGTITSLVGAVGSIASLVLKNTKEAVMMEMPAPAPYDKSMEDLGIGGPSIPIEEPIDWLMYMPEIFLVGIVILLIAYYLQKRIRKVEA